MSKRSSSQQRTTTSQAINHTGCDGGHDWHLTTGEAFRICSRRDCDVVERLIYGSWMPVTLSSPAQSSQHHHQVSSYQQLAFWSADQHTERPLDLESMTLLTKEQRAHFARLEKEYYNLSSDRRVRKVW